jgi:hypothetical protein
MRVAADAIAAGSLLKLDIRPVRESVLRPYLSPLFQCLLEGTSFRLLAEAHPPKAQIKSSGFTGTVDEFLFPIHQAAYLLGLGCGIACYNDDNSRYVDLTRKIARRTNAIRGLTLNAHIALLAKDPSRLRSWDGRRMAKSYNNTLSVCATPGETQKFAERMVGRANAGDPSFDTCSQSDLERLYISAFGRQPSPSIVLGRERVAILARVLTDWCKDLTSFQKNQDEVKMCLIDGERMAIRRIDMELKRAGISRDMHSC